MSDGMVVTSLYSLVDKFYEGRLMLNDVIQGDMWVDKERSAVRDIQVCC